MALFGSQAAANTAQKKLVAKLMTMTADDLAWHTIKLDMGQATSSGWTIEVCSPVLLDGYYVPVSAAETWKFARAIDAFPLTRAVADQVHNHVLANHGADYAIKFIPIAVLGPITKFPVSEFQVYWDSTFLQPTKYMTDPSVHKKGLDQGPLVSGSHKLWLLSNFKSVNPNDTPRAVNYGFDFPAGPTNPKLSNRGPYLDKKWTVDQSLGNRHGNTHWDYSQLLQLMRNLRIDGQTEKEAKPADMIRTLLQLGNEKIWDEGTKGFDRPLGV